MYGHAPSTLTTCERCPGWAPSYAVAIDDDGRKVCAPHAYAGCADLQVPA